MTNGVLDAGKGGMRNARGMLGSMARGLSLARASVALSLFQSICATPVRAQRVDRIGAADVAAALDQSMASDSRGVLFRAARDGNAQYVMNRRTSPSAVELHCEWDDLIVVRHGAGVLEHGGKLRKPERYAWSEWRAATIVDGREVNLVAGDIVRVPAGEAHRIRSLGDAPLVYVVVKMRSVAIRPCSGLPNEGR